MNQEDSIETPKSTASTDNKKVDSMETLRNTTSLTPDSYQGQFSSM